MQQGLNFSDLNSEESHRMFKKFVRHWNAGKLDEVRLVLACHPYFSIELQPVTMRVHRTTIKVCRQLTWHMGPRHSTSGR